MRFTHCFYLGPVYRKNPVIAANARRLGGLDENKAFPYTFPLVLG